MKRGDVVRTVAEFVALPMGAELLGLDGVVYLRSDFGPGDILHADALPALVRVVGPVEPEWLEAAAVAAQAADKGRPWDELNGGAQNMWRGFAKAAVAAADKARGIVNSREEFDALPAGTRVTGPRTGVYRAGATPPYPPGYPCIVLD